VQEHGHWALRFGGQDGPSTRQKQLRGRQVPETYRLSLVSRSLAPATRSVYLRSVRQFCGWMESTQRLFLNPATGLVIREPTRPLLPVPSPEQVAQLLAQPDTATEFGVRDRTLLETAYSTGVRREELGRLTMPDVDLEHETLRIVGKGGRERVVPLGRIACHWLERYLTQARPPLLAGVDSTALWVGSRGRQLHYAALPLILRRYVRMARLTTPITLHSLRRACVTHMLEQGAHPVHLQQLLGHAGLRSLSQYLRLSIRGLRQTHAQSKPGR
jgi:integrase/recombinase XerD